MPIEHLPERYRPAARSFRDWCATDKGLLLILFCVFLVRTSTYLFQDGWLLPHVLDIHAPLLSSMQWLIATVVVGASVVVPGEKMEIVGLTVAAIMLTIWGLLFAWTGWAEFTARGILYIGLALMSLYTVWRGHSATIRVRGEDGARSAESGGRE